MNTDEDASFPDFVPPPPPVEEPEPEQFEEDTEQGESQDEETFPEPVKREKLKKEDMFISTPSSEKIKKNIDSDKPTVKPIKPERKKRVMTDEAKAKLAIARAKGLETRKRNAELRRRAKQEKQEEKEIVKAVRRKRLNKLKKELEEKEPEQQEVIKPERVVEKVIEKGFTQEDMNQAIAKALEANEKARQIRKAEKKKKKEEEEHEKRIYNTVARAVNPHDSWGFCFQ